MKIRLGQAAVLLLLPLLAACAEEVPVDEESEATPPALQGQVIARVNGEELTIHQLNAELARAQVPDELDRQEARNQVLQRIIDRIVMAQMAREEEIHRRPSVMLEMRRAQEDVLASTYLRQQMAEMGPVARDEAEAFVNENPYLFAEREFFIFDQIMIDANYVDDELMGELEDRTTMAEMEELLDSRSVPFRRQPNTGLTSRFPPRAAQTVAELPDGELFIIRTPLIVYVSQILERRPEPLFGEDAVRAARQVLQVQRNATDAEAITARMRARANIEYLGEYGPPAALTGPADMAEGDGAETDLETGNDETAPSVPALDDPFTGGLRQ